MRYNGLSALFFGLLLLMTGCASIWNSSPGDVSITSTPEGADVSIDELDPSCQTPCELEVKPDRYEVHISKPGYKTETVKLVKRMSGWFWANFIVGPYAVIGMGIDWLTGSIMRIDPREVHVKLQPLANRKPEENDEDEDDDDGSGSEESDTEKEPGQRNLPPAPKLESGQPPPAPVAPVPEAEPLPSTPEARQLQAAVPQEYVDRQIGLYYGDLPAKKRELVKKRLYRIMYDLQQSGERADIDEAVRIEKFRYPP